MVEILALVLQHDEQAVLCAVELALQAGVPTKTHVLNILHRLTDARDHVVSADAGTIGWRALKQLGDRNQAVERDDDLVFGAIRATSHPSPPSMCNDLLAKPLT
jgi:hypothetical protein